MYRTCGQHIIWTIKTLACMRMYQWDYKLWHVFLCDLLMYTTFGQHIFRTVNILRLYAAGGIDHCSVCETVSYSFWGPHARGAVNSFCLKLSFSTMSLSVHSDSFVFALPWPNQFVWQHILLCWEYWEYGRCEIPAVLQALLWVLMLSSCAELVGSMELEPSKLSLVCTCARGSTNFDMCSYAIRSCTEPLGRI